MLKFDVIIHIELMQFYTDHKLQNLPTSYQQTLKNAQKTDFYLFILMILMREGDTPEGAPPKGLGWPLHREKKKNLNEMKAGNPSQTQKIGQY